MAMKTVGLRALRGLSGCGLGGKGRVTPMGNKKTHKFVKWRNEVYEMHGAQILVDTGDGTFLLPSLLLFCTGFIDFRPGTCFALPSRRWK